MYAPGVPLTIPLLTGPATISTMIIYADKTRHWWQLGVVLLNGVWRADFQWTGLSASLIFISSFICEAAYSVVGKTVVERYSPTKMLAISLLVLDYILVSPQVYGAYFFGKITIGLYWFMQIAFLTGSK